MKGVYSVEDLTFRRAHGCGGLFALGVTLFMISLTGGGFAAEPQLTIKMHGAVVNIQQDGTACGEGESGLRRDSRIAEGHCHAGLRRAGACARGRIGLIK